MNYSDPTTYAADIPVATARAAHSGTSFVPERRADAAIASYCSDLATSYQKLLAECETFDQRDALAEAWPRYRETYKALALRYLRSRSGLMSTMITGASKFPAARMNKQGDRVHKRLGEWISTTARLMKRLRRRLWPVQGPIMAGDSDAVTRLEEKLAKLKQEREFMKAVNKQIRSAAKQPAETQVAQLAAMLEKEGFNAPAPEVAIKLIRPDSLGRRGYADYALTNIGATIRTTEKRLETLRTAKATPSQTKTSADGNTRMEHDVAAHRVRIFFPGKPDRTTITTLKSNGFRWSPTIEAWQAYPTAHALSYANQLISTL